MNDKPLVEPYDFVPLGERPLRVEPTWHHRFYGEEDTDEGRYSGILECSMDVKTPVFVYDTRFARLVEGGHEKAEFPVFNGVAVIPGTSLKGVIRSVVEAVEPCCFTLPTDWDSRGQRTYRGAGITRGKKLSVKLPKGYEHCTEAAKVNTNRPKDLCPACRLFGSQDPKGKWAYAGNVSISDARSLKSEYTLGDYITLDVLSTPKPEGRTKRYTLSDGLTIQGRKFYRHRYPPNPLKRAPYRDGKPKRDRQNKTVRPVINGTFHFTIDYTDLSKQELCLLLYAVVLEEGLWHKIGMGKPIGLGSVDIRIEKWTTIDRKKRYKKLGGGVSDPLEGDVLKADLGKWLQESRERGDSRIKKLREILRPDPTVDVRYRVSMPRGYRRSRW